VTDEDLLTRIHRLVEEEHQLHALHEGTGLAATDAARVRAVDEELDQCWDLLRQRRALRGAGLDPGEARARQVDTVEGYQQ
jgi:hypothetical protein